jgi:hypothetical protein
MRARDIKMLAERNTFDRHPEAAERSEALEG